MRKTNPIPGPAGWDGAARARDARKCAKRSQFRPLRPSRAPIIPVFQQSSVPVPAGANAQNEPNSRRRRVGRGLGDEGRRCKTKPISGRRPVEYPAFHYSIIPPFQSDADRAEESRSAGGRDTPLSQCVRFFSDVKMSPPPAKLLTLPGRYDIDDSGHVGTRYAQDVTCVWTEGAVQLCDVEEGSPNAMIAFGRGSHCDVLHLGT
jgi:hypothetical protein